jgi:hypothetical protein
MRKSFIVSLLFCTIFGVSYLQAQWAKAYSGLQEENPTAALLIEEGKLLVAGFSLIRTNPNSYTTELEYKPWFMQISDNGSGAERLLFNSEKTGADSKLSIQEWVRSLRPTEDGGYILAGYMESSWPEGELINDYNCAFFLKLSAEFQIEWQRFFGNDDGTTEERALAVEPTDEGGYIAVGSTSSFGMGGRDVLVMKLDSAGQVVWQKAYGGEGREEAHLVQQTPDGGFIVIGYTTSFQSEIDPQEGEPAEEPGPPDAPRIWVLRLNPEGALIWQQLCGRDYDLAYSMVLTPEGEVLLGGSSEGEPVEGQESDRELFLLKLREDGDIAFQRTFVSESDACLTHLIQRGENKFLAVGTLELEGDKDLLLIQFADTGHIDWMRIFGAGEVDGQISQETGAVVAVNEADEVTVVGKTSRLGPQGDDLLVLRLTSDGRVPNCDLMRPLERYPLRDLGTIPVKTTVEFTASEISPVNIEFHATPPSVGMIRDVCQSKKNLLRR